MSRARYRLTSLLLIASLASGCAHRSAHRPTEPSAPVLTITVFDDGFHSGFIVPSAAAPYALDPERVEWPSAYVEIGFGEARWLQGLDRSWLHAVRTALWPSDGMLLMVDLDRCERLPPDNGPSNRYWRVPLTRAGVEAFFARLDAWIDRTHVYRRPPEDPQFFFLSTRHYTALRDCHDFTIDLLRAVDFPIVPPVVVSAGRFDAAMDRGMRRLARAHIEAVGP